MIPIRVNGVPAFDFLLFLLTLSLLSDLTLFMIYSDANMTATTNVFSHTAHGCTTNRTKIVIHFSVYLSFTTYERGQDEEPRQAKERQPPNNLSRRYRLQY